MSVDVDLDTVGSCILFYCCDKLLVIYVLLAFSGFMNLTSRPTSRLADGIRSHAHGDLTGDPRVVTPRDLSPEEATSSRQYHCVLCVLVHVRNASTSTPISSEARPLMSE